MSKLDLSHATISLTWDQLTQRVANFLDAWERLDAPPPLQEFLPAEPLALRRMVLSELAKIDLEQRATRGLAARVDHYVQLFPELADKGEPPCDLIYEEYHVRRAAGETIKADEYYERFPNNADGLRRLFPATPNATTAMVRKQALEELAPGQKIDDFDLISRLGKGSFASVFLARQISLQRLVALKVSADRGNETFTLAKLDHPNIVRVYDERKLPEKRLKLLYMQYAPGGTLEDLVVKLTETSRGARNGKLVGEVVRAAQERSGMLTDDSSSAGRRFSHASWPETVCRMGVQLASALHYAHQEKVLHRDVKPANVLLAADGTPKLADFNISFCSQLEGSTPAAYFGGSLAYMSPEQLEACNPHHSRMPEDLDGRSDLFSLAVLLWEMLFGQRPFQDPEDKAGWTAMLEEMVKLRQTTPPKAHRHQLDDELTRAIMEVLLKAMAGDPNQRHADGSEFARELLLCMQPRVQQMLTPPRQGFLAFLRKAPYWAILVTILLPNALGGFLNQQFNYYNFVERLKDGWIKYKDAEAHGATLPPKPKRTEAEVDRLDVAFHKAMWTVNGIAFPFGIAIGTYLVWPLRTTLARIRAGQHPSPTQLANARRIALRFGEYIAWLGAVEWLTSGLVFPPLIRGLSNVRVDSATFGLFFFSLAICGLIAAVFPYFGATWLGVRVFYPALLDGKPIDAGETRLLSLVAARTPIYLLLSFVVPFVGMFLLLISPFRNADPTTIDKDFIFTCVLLGVGLICFYVAWLAFLAIRRDIAALSIATRPLDSFGTSSESIEVG